MSSTSDHSIEEGESTSQIHVLAVDDSVIDRKVIEKLLKNSCYKVTTMDSGRRALEFLGLGDNQNVANGLQVNMIITDYCMPGMSGHDLLKRIKESSKLKEIPVVVMSSDNESSRKRRCLDEGAEEFILKPVQISDVKRLRDYIRRDHKNDSVWLKYSSAGMEGNMKNPKSLLMECEWNGLLKVRAELSYLSSDICVPDHVMLLSRNL